MGDKTITEKQPQQQYAIEKLEKHFMQRIEIVREANPVSWPRPV